MKKSLGAFLLICWMVNTGYANTTEMVFYPKADLSSAVAHFYHQGEKLEKYGFLFDKGFNKEQIVYAQPSNYTIETQKDGKVKLLFGSTERYSYMEQIQRDDFIVESSGKMSALLICGGDCAGSQECVTEQNILTLMVPQGYSVVSYKGLDDTLKELKSKEWKIREGAYTLFAPKVKGACIYMKLEKIMPLNKKVETVGKASNVQVYQNRELFDIGDIVLSSFGKAQLVKLVEKMKSTDTIRIRIFQDIVAPKRLAQSYPSAQLFSTARAEEIKNQLIQLGIDASRIEINVVEDKLEKTHVEVSFI